VCVCACVCVCMYVCVCVYVNTNNIYLDSKGTKKDLIAHLMVGMVVSLENRQGLTCEVIAAINDWASPKVSCRIDWIFGSYKQPQFLFTRTEDYAIRKIKMVSVYACACVCVCVCVRVRVWYLLIFYLLGNVDSSCCKTVGTRANVF